MTPRRPAARPWPLLAAMWDQKQKVELKNGPAGMMATRLHPKPSLGVEKYTWQGIAYLVLVHARVPPPGSLAWRQVAESAAAVLPSRFHQFFRGSPQWGPSLGELMEQIASHHLLTRLVCARLESCCMLRCKA